MSSSLVVIGPDQGCAGGLHDAARWPLRVVADFRSRHQHDRFEVLSVGVCSLRAGALDAPGLLALRGRAVGQSAGAGRLAGQIVRWMSGGINWRSR